MGNDKPNPGTASSTVQDHRQKPRGVLPRQLQMWLMVGIAVVIVLCRFDRSDRPARARPAHIRAPYR